jgi:uncharacterized protein (TIGR02118 family)
MLGDARIVRRGAGVDTSPISRDRLDGGSQALIGACSFLRRRPGDTLTHFETHWREVHGPLAADLPGVARYLQGHIIRDETITNHRALDLGIDGFAQQWFASEADRQACYDSEQEAVCDVDSLLFIGATARIVSDVRVHVPIDGRPEGRRIVMFLADETLPAAPQVAALARVPGLTGLVEHYVVKEGAAPTITRDSMPITPVRLIDLYFPTVERAASVAIEDFSGVASFTCRNVHFIVPE